MRTQEYQLASDVPGLGIPDYAQPDRIALHTSNIKRIAALAGYHGTMTVVGYCGERVQGAVSIGGNAGNGVAAAAMGASVAQTKPGEIGGAQATPLHIRSNFTVRLNTNHITDALPLGRARDPSAWAHVIDRTIGSVLSRAAWNHLVRDKTSRGEIFRIGGLHGAIQVVAGMDFMRNLAAEAGYSQLLSRLIVTGAVALGANVLAGSIALEEGRPAREACYSLIPFKHPDRAALAWLGSKMCKFARVID